MADKSAWSLIGSLFFPRRPSAVLGRVGAVIVDSVKSHALRPLAHICEEVRELIPALADSDPTTAIVRVASCIRIETPLPEPFPDGIKGMLRCAVS